MEVSNGREERDSKKGCVGINEMKERQTCTVERTKEKCRKEP